MENNIGNFVVDNVLYILAGIFLFISLLIGIAQFIRIFITQPNSKLGKEYKEYTERSKKASKEVLSKERYAEIKNQMQRTPLTNRSSIENLRRKEDTDLWTILLIFFILQGEDKSEISEVIGVEPEYIGVMNEIIGEAELDAPDVAESITEDVHIAEAEQVEDETVFEEFEEYSPEVKDTTSVDEYEDILNTTTDNEDNTPNKEIIDLESILTIDSSFNDDSNESSYDHNND